MQRAKRKIDKELDLLKYVTRSRLVVTGIIASFSPYQRQFIRRMSRVIVKEPGQKSTSDTPDTDSETYDTYKWIDRVCAGGKKVDERLINLFKIGRQRLELGTE